MNYLLKGDSHIHYITLHYIHILSNSLKRKHVTHISIQSINVENLIQVPSLTYFSTVMTITAYIGVT